MEINIQANIMVRKSAISKDINIMADIYDLPTSLTVGKKLYTIRSDFRTAIEIMIMFNDPELSQQEKLISMLEILYEDLDGMALEDMETAALQAIAFLDGGKMGNAEREDNTHNKRLYDFEQDFSIIISAVNKVAGMEVRSLPYLHWWTFLGYFHEIKDGTFSEVLNIRYKKAYGKRLEKHEQEFYRRNRKMIDLRKRYTKEEEEYIAELQRMLDS